MPSTTQLNALSLCVMFNIGGHHGMHDAPRRPLELLARHSLCLLVVFSVYHSLRGPCPANDRLTTQVSYTSHVHAVAVSCNPRWTSL
jgi:hypothetical protein